ncbi:MAG TPA: MBL fold metallo-hydrolase [Lacibacter sp.]|nr:MBL fold metallo-hydrolase [Lacibacter sp.]HMO88745.1 MBL fold metallo-hydrolase [Lacibacter sp.]HMP85975.1 MBL fold metallo-hydrolase [Lacibacter sp.]
MKIIPLSEGRFTVDATKVFVPFDPATDDLKSRPAGSLLVDIQPFAVVTEKDILVLDTGLGFAEPDGTPQLHANLIRAGIRPEQVTRVLLTHLHRDHAGGIAFRDPAQGVSGLSFPNATYVVNRQELEIAQSGLSRSYAATDVEALVSSGQLDLVESEGELDGYIQYKWTGGHSPWHQVFWIRERGETIFFGGDVAPQLFQMKTRIVTRYDFDGKLASQLRTQWWQQGQEENWTFLFYHDLKSPVFKRA